MLRALHELDTRVVVVLSQLGQVAVGHRRFGGLVQVCGRNETTVVGDTEREVGRKVLVESAFSVDDLSRVSKLGVTGHLRASEVGLITVAERVRVNVVLGVVEEGVSRIGVVSGLQGKFGPLPRVKALPLDSVQVTRLLASSRLERTGDDHIDQVLVLA